jgi:hypothetical protein
MACLVQIGGERAHSLVHLRAELRQPRARRAELRERLRRGGGVLARLGGELLQPLLPGHALAGMGRPQRVATDVCGSWA